MPEAAQDHKTMRLPSGMHSVSWLRPTYAFRLIFSMDAKKRAESSQEGQVTGIVEHNRPEYPYRDIFEKQREAAREEFASDPEDSDSDDEYGDNSDGGGGDSLHEDNANESRDNADDAKKDVPPPYTSPKDSDQTAGPDQQSAPGVHIRGINARQAASGLPRPSLELDTGVSPALSTSSGTSSISSSIGDPGVHFRDLTLDRWSLEIKVKVQLLPCLPKLKLATSSTDMEQLKECVDDALEYAKTYDVSPALRAKCYFYVGLVHFVSDLHEQKDELDSMKRALSTFEQVREARDHSVEALWVQQWQIHLKNACKRVEDERARPSSSYSIRSAISRASSWFFGARQPSVADQNPFLLMRAGQHIGIWETPLTPLSRPATGNSHVGMLSRIPSFETWTSSRPGSGESSRPSSGAFSRQATRSDKYSPETLRRPPTHRKATSDESLRAQLTKQRGSQDGARLLSTPEKQRYAVMEGHIPGQKLFSDIARKATDSPINISPGSDISPSNLARSTSISFHPHPESAQPPCYRNHHHQHTDSGDHDDDEEDESFLHARRRKSWSQRLGGGLRRLSSSVNYDHAAASSSKSDELELAEEGASPVKVNFFFNNNNNNNKFLRNLEKKDSRRKTVDFSLNSSSKLPEELAEEGFSPVVLKRRDTMAF